jgi:CMP-N-acetylneuraminic acid synthetase
MGILVTICARGGSKGLPSKNVRPLLGRPLICHTIEHALGWAKADQVIVSTDSEEIREVARRAGAQVPFLRPTHLATDAAPKVPVISHALREAEATFRTRFDVVVDLDPTAPLRTPSDIDAGVAQFHKGGCDVCFSVVKGRKSPYFNVVERDPQVGTVRLAKPPPAFLVTRQSAPQVFDINGSVYVYSRAFLLRDPVSIWDGTAEIFEMPPESAFDIDTERDFVVTEALMKHYMAGGDERVNRARSSSSR